MALLSYVTISPPLSSTVPPHLYVGSFILNITGDWLVKSSWAFMVVTHVLESLYTVTLVKRYNTPFGVGVSSPSLCRRLATHLYYQAMYVLGTLLFGFPSWLELKKNVQAARINSILKGK